MGNLIIDIKSRIKQIVVFLERGYIREASAEFGNLEREINAFLNTARSGEARREMIELKRFIELASENLGTKEFDMHRAFMFLAQAQRRIKKFWGI